MSETKVGKQALPQGLLQVLEAQGSAINTEPVWTRGTSVLDLPAGTYDVVSQTGKFGQFKTIRFNPEHWDIPANRLVSIIVHRKSNVSDNGCVIAEFRAKRNFQPTGGGKPIRMGETKLFAVAV